MITSTISRLNIVKMGLETGESLLLNTQLRCMASYTLKSDQCAKHMASQQTHGRSYEVNA